MNTDEHKKESATKADILNAIKEGRVHMRPKWHFIVRASLAALGGILAFIGLLYIASLCLYFLRASGLLFVPAFGPRGWAEFFRALPWLLVACSILLLIVLEVLIRRYAFAYRRPLVYSVIVLMLLASIGSYAADRARFHEHVRSFSTTHQLSPVESFYHLFDVDRFYHVFHGRVISLSTDSMVIREGDGDIFNVRYTAQTQFPFGVRFTHGDPVVVFGSFEDGVVIADGVRPVDD